MRRAANGDYIAFDDRLDSQRRFALNGNRQRQPSVEEGIDIAERNARITLQNMQRTASNIGRFVSFIIPKRKEV